MLAKACSDRDIGIITLAKPELEAGHCVDLSTSGISQEHEVYDLLLEGCLSCCSASIVVHHCRMDNSLSLSRFFARGESSNYLLGDDGVT